MNPQTVVYDNDIVFRFFVDTLIITNHRKGNTPFTFDFVAYFKNFKRVHDISNCKTLEIRNINIENFCIPVFKETPLENLIIRKCKIYKIVTTAFTQNINNISIIDVESRFLLKIFSHFFRQDNFSIQELVFKECEINYEDIVVMEDIFCFLVKNVGGYDNVALILSDCKILSDFQFRPKPSHNFLKYFVCIDTKFIPNFESNSLIKWSPTIEKSLEIEREDEKTFFIDFFDNI